MQIKATWSQPIPLKKSKEQSQIFEIDTSILPNEPGVYIFARQHGAKVTPIYVGETLNIQSRTKSHLKSLPLMREIENAPTGKRFLIYCTVQAGSKEKAKKHIKIVEKALILHVQSEGHILFNIKGTKLPTDEISFIGNRTSESIAPRTMLIKKALV